MYFALSFHSLRSSGSAFINFPVKNFAFETSSWPPLISSDLTWGEYQLLTLWVEDAHLMVAVNTMDQKSKINLLIKKETLNKILSRFKE